MKYSRPPPDTVLIFGAVVDTFQELTLLEWIFVLVTMVYTPFGIYQAYLTIRSTFLTDEKYLSTKTRLEKPNNAIVVITTNGMATDVVEKIISAVKGYELPVEIFVVKELRDDFSYSCNEITVPKEFACPNMSRNKMRALQYGNIWLHEHGYDKETYIIHLDDDSIVDRDYIEYVRNYLTAEGAQGCILLRAFGRHMLSSLADIVRIANCEVWCKRRNKINKPQFVHGEGIVVRADIEYEIGWDYGTYGAEDLIMGLKISQKYTFDHIPMGKVFIAPPTTVKDYYKQRRRWFWSVIHNDGVVRRLSPVTFVVYMYMYLVGVLGLISLCLFPILLLTQIYLSPIVIVLCVINIVCFFGYYQYGASFLNSKKVSLILLAVQIPIAFYEGFTVLYSIIRKPDFNTFETIKKV
ncbi:MAG: glycosyltransferase family 2 protein [Candidatus Methanogranum gryphiswaldense]|nr:MAG: glycosyltransferase family 2 protein [Candidatus Methanogranum sp. U3.2.1]